MTAHPDLDLLSALVDGIDEHDTAAHVAGCATCASDVDALRRAARAVADVPAPRATEADAAVAAALSAAFPREREPVRAATVPLHPRRRRPLPAWAFAAAAAIVVATLAVPLVRSLAGGSSTSSKASTAAGTTQDLGAEGSPGAGSGAGASGATASGTTASGGAASAQVQAVADLGSVDGPDTLRTRLASFSASPQPPSAAPESQAANDRPGSPAGAAPSSCSAEATAASAAGGRPVTMRATLVWRGTPAVVFVVTPPQGRQTAVVVSRADCARLDVVSL